MEKIVVNILSLFLRKIKESMFKRFLVLAVLVSLSIQNNYACEEPNIFLLPLRALGRDSKIQLTVITPNEKDDSFFKSVKFCQGRDFSLAGYKELFGECGNCNELYKKIGTETLGVLYQYETGIFVCEYLTSKKQLIKMVVLVKCYLIPDTLNDDYLSFIYTIVYKTEDEMQAAISKFKVFSEECVKIVECQNSTI